MIEHELLIVTIEAQWPQLIHGADYLVAHPINTITGQQTGDAYIMRWEAAGIPQPDITTLLGQAEGNRVVLTGRKALALRATLLSGSDWTQAADSPLQTEKKAAYAVFRQALRDITTQPGFPVDINWPVQPA